MSEAARDDRFGRVAGKGGISEASAIGRSILRKIKPETDDEGWEKIAFVLSRAITPTRFSLLFLMVCWLLLRFVYIKAGATLDVGELVVFASSMISIVVAFYVILILLKCTMFVALMRGSTSCIVPWGLFGVIVLVCLISFDGFVLAGASIYSLAAASDVVAIENLKALLEGYKFIPAAPVVLAIFASVIPWDAMPKIRALDLPFVASVCIGVTVLGFYSFFWKFLPKHLSLGGILFGAVGAGVLIFYIATPAAQSPAAHGKLLIRVMVTIILTCILLAVYMDYWKKAAREFLSDPPQDESEAETTASTPDAETPDDDRDTATAEARNRADAAREYVRRYREKDIGLLQRVANRDLSLTYLPPGHVEVGLWVFFGLVVVGDALGGH